MNTIHPTAIIGPDVTLGDGNTVGPYAVLVGDVRIGDGNWIGAGTKIGAPPEVRSVPHTATDWDGNGGRGVAIGNGNVIREDVNIHSGWKASTAIGSGAFIMNQVYIAHDCQLQDDVTLASHVAVGGHVRIGHGANIGLGTAIHQFRIIGALAMVGLSSAVTRNVPPFVKAFGNPCRVHGVNIVGAQRAGLSENALSALRSWSAAADGINDLADVPGLADDVRWYEEESTA